MTGDECHSMQLIDGDGAFNVDGLDRFLKAIRLADCGLSYAVVSIMGPQSSGKSTLLNHLFGTNFREMDALRGRIQTTKGIWIAKGVGIKPCTIVLDLEGTDGRERGEDDTTFEKQSALFALAISDVVLINMWCHDIGREQAANKPLLKTVFQVMMRLFSPRKTTLLFVIRDKTKTPLELIDPLLRGDIQKIWNSISRPHIHKDTALEEFFNVEVTALPSFEEKEELFKEQIARLREQFINSIAPRGLAGDRRSVVPASGFLYSTQQIWKVVRENKELDLPAHTIMVATVRCEEISNEKLSHLASDKSWLELEEAVRSGPVLGFGKKLDSILDAYLSEYEAEAIYFDYGVRAAKKKQLESRALDLVHPAFEAMLGHLHYKSLDKFKVNLEQSLKHISRFSATVQSCSKASFLEFDTGFADVKIKHADWDASKVKEKLRRDIEAHAQSVHHAKISQLQADYENQIKEALAEPVEVLLDEAGQDTWPSIRRIYRCEMEKALSGFLSSLSGFEFDQNTNGKMLEHLKNYGRSIVEKKTREAAGKVLMYMKDRFSMVFSHDNGSLPRVWTGKENMGMITKNAHVAAVELLSVLVAIRWEDKQDKIKIILTSALIDNPLPQGRSIASSHLLASSTWEEVSPENTLITPVQCKSIWRRFKTETEYMVAQAISAQEAHKRNNSRFPALWVIVTIAVLGFNEFMMLLRNPLYLFALFILFLLSRALWFQLNITGEFQNGMLSGVFALSARFLPAVMSLLRKLAGEVQANYHGTRHL